MLNYNSFIFLETLEEAEKRFDFNEIFYEILIPFLNEVGMLWQANTINSSHEHFITNLIKQKLWAQINDLQKQNKAKGKTFVLFLPKGEANDMSLLFLNNLLLSNGNKTIFLGPNIETEYLLGLSELHDNLTFVSYFTVAPQRDEINTYLEDFKEKICIPSSHEMWVMGRLLKEVAVPFDVNIKVIDSFKDFEKLITS